MEPDELNDEPQLRSELSAEEQAASDKGAADAFRLAFGSDEQDNAAASAPASSPAAAPAPAASKIEEAVAGGDSREADTEDPFKDLHPKVRDMLAEIPVLKRNADALHGRLAPTQQKLAQTERELAELKARTNDSPAPAPAPSEALERVRGELPEVAEAIEEMFKRTNTAAAPAAAPEPSPAPAPAADTGDDMAAQAALTRVHSDWISTMNSTDYKLWLASQDEATQQTLMSTGDPLIVSDALTKFKVHRDRGNERAREAAAADARRNNRTERALDPGRSNAPAGGGGSGDPEHDAFLEAFNSP